MERGFKTFVSVYVSVYITNVILKARVGRVVNVVAKNTRCINRNDYVIVGGDLNTHSMVGGAGRENT